MDNYAINYEDDRFKQIEQEQADAVKKSNDTYNSMINASDTYYQQQIDAAKQYGETQSQIQNEQTQLAVDEINQAKEKANKDYLKEQSGAYTDWQKQSNKYGVNAEQMASNGLANTGYSESSQVSMYNTYQNRVSTARESYNQAILNYDNSIKEARLQNSSALAQIAYNTLQTQLELSLNGFQYKNTLLQTQLQNEQSLNDTYYNRWQNVLSQMNTENSLAESIRQYNENMAYQKERDKVADSQWQKEYNLAKKSASRSYSSGSSSSSKKTKSEKTYKSTSTPILSSKEAQNWISSLNTSIKSSNYTISETDLTNAINTAYQSGILTDTDVQRVLKSFGAK